MPENNAGKNEILNDIKQLTSSINFNKLEENSISFHDDFLASVKRASELMGKLITETGAVGQFAKKAFADFLANPDLKKLELCFSRSTMTGLFSRMTLDDAELRRLLISLSKTVVELRKIQGAIDVFEKNFLFAKRLKR